MKKIFRIIVCAAVCAGLFAQDAEACTTGIISAEKSGTGRPLLWKQRDTDDYYNHMEYFKGEKYSFTALVNAYDPIREDVWIGANEKGFAIGNNVSYNINEKKYDNPSCNGAVMKEALGVCATVDEFEAFIAARPVPKGARANFAVIDAQGGAAYFEVGDERYFRFDVKDGGKGYLFRTNFSVAGVEDQGAGYIRYAAAEKMFTEQNDNFTPKWILSVPSRSFYHGLIEKDMKDVKDKALGSGFIIDQDYIPRYSSVSSVVVEGVNPGQDPKETVLWCAIGYPPCSYAIPAWVGAQNELPSCLTSKDWESLAPANEFAMELKGIVFPIVRGNGDKYLDYVTLRKEILPEVEKAENVEIKEGEKVKAHIDAKGFDIEAIKAFNKGADERFAAYKEKMTAKLKK